MLPGLTHRNGLGLAHSGSQFWTLSPFHTKSSSSSCNKMACIAKNLKEVDISNFLSSMSWYGINLSFFVWFNGYSPCNGRIEEKHIGILCVIQWLFTLQWENWRKTHRHSLCDSMAIHLAMGELKNWRIAHRHSELQVQS